MRWKAVFGGLALALAVTAGCKQQCFLTREDLNRVTLPEMPNGLECDPTAGSKPILERTSAPADVSNPERKIRYISLAESVAIAMEQGTIGDTNLQGTANPGQTAITINPTGGLQDQADGVRVLALDPAIVGSNIELSLSKFDAVWNTSMTWNGTDRPLASSSDRIIGGGATAIEQETAAFQTGVYKPLPAGGVAGITFNTNYTLTNLPANVNPSYQPSLQFQFEQPLLQGFGVEINQLRSSTPGSLLSPAGTFTLQPGVEGILLTRVRFDAQRAEFERQVDIMATNVEVAYWNLYNAYWTLYSQEAALRQAYEAWKISLAKLQAGKIGVADLAQTRGQYELFRVQRLQALGGDNPTSVLAAEANLRALLGLPVEDGTRLVPSDAPTLAEFKPDWDTALNEALTLRPELYEARQNLKLNQLQVDLAKNSLLPDLRSFATYDINSLGSQLDGPNTNNALRNLASNHFNNWELGLRLNVPIGFRNANANVRIAKLNLARSYEVLRVGELKISENLQTQYRAVSTNYALIGAQRAQREAFGEQLKARFQEYIAGKTTLDLLLEAQRFWASALQQEYAAITAYNQSLARFEFEKGTILQHDNVVIGEGPLPKCVCRRAVEHQRERSAALELRERAAPVNLSDCKAATTTALPQATPTQTPTLPDLWQQAPPLKDAPVLPPVSATKPTIPSGLTPAETPIAATSPWSAMPPNDLPVLTAPPRPKKGKKPSDVFGTTRPTDAPAAEESVPPVPADAAPAGGPAVP